MATTGGADTGLRQRKKAATRAALSWAAVRLAVERGFDDVLVEEIAAEAGVSPRTFNNYFSSKAEAICAHHLDRVRGITDALRARPVDEPIWAAVTAAVLSRYGVAEESPDPKWLAGVRLMTSELALRGEMLKAHATAEREFAAVIAERTGLDADRDLYPQLLASAVGAAVQVATGRWLRADPPVPLAPLVTDALAQIAAGLPAPTTT